MSCADVTRLEGGFMPQWDERRCSRSPQMRAIEYVQMYLVRVRRSDEPPTLRDSPMKRRRGSHCRAGAVEKRNAMGSGH